MEKIQLYIDLYRENFPAKCKILPIFPLLPAGVLMSIWLNFSQVPALSFIIRSLVNELLLKLT